MKIVIDMNLSIDRVQFLGARGHEALHWTSVGLPDDENDTIMQWAFDNEATILSNDLDFGTMLALSGASRPSVIQIRSVDLRPSAIGMLVARTMTLTAMDLANGALVTVSPPRVRVNPLPIQIS